MSAWVKEPMTGAQGYEFSKVRLDKIGTFLDAFGRAIAAKAEKNEAPGAGPPHGDFADGLQRIAALAPEERCEVTLDEGLRSGHRIRAERVGDMFHVCSTSFPAKRPA